MHRIFEQHALQGVLSILLTAMALTATPAMAQENLLPNGDFETGTGDMPASWTTQAWMPGRSNFAWKQGIGRNGSYAIRIDSPQENDASWISEEISVNPGEYYTLRGYIRGENITGSTTVGAHLNVEGTWIGSNTLLGSSHGWQEAVLVFKAESNTVKIACRLGFWANAVTGTAYFDDISLIPGIQTTLNGNFEQGTEISPTSWYPGGPSGESRLTWEAGIGRMGSRGIRIESQTPGEAYWQSDPIGVTPGELYSLNGYIKAEGVTLHQNGNFAALIYLSGLWIHSQVLTGTFDWTKITLVFRAPESGLITIRCALGLGQNLTSGTVIFDDLSLSPGIDPSYERRDGKHITVILERRDTGAFTDEAHFQRWMDHLDTIYEAYEELVGGAPFEGERIHILSVPGYPGGRAVAGNPILWMQEYIKDALKSANDRDDWVGVPLHELAHDFDHVNAGNWLFAGEFWAELKRYYVVERFGIRDGQYVGGTQRIVPYQEAYDRTIPKGLYDEAALVYCFIRLKNFIKAYSPKAKTGWEAFTLTFDAFGRNALDPPSRLQKFELFLDKLSVYAEIDVRKSFVRGELDTIRHGLTTRLSEGLTVTPGSVFQGQEFRVDFTLKAIDETPVIVKHVEVAARCIDDPSIVTILATYHNLTIPAQGSWSPSPPLPGRIPTQPGRYEITLRGKGDEGTWIEFVKEYKAKNPITLNVLPVNAYILWTH